MEWISVKEKTPDNFQEVIIYAKGSYQHYPHVIVVAEYHLNANEYNQYDLEVDEYCQPTVGVTHWMPLPPPPSTQLEDAKESE